MITPQMLFNILERVVKDLRRRYGDKVFIDKIVEHRSKYVIYMAVNNRNVKIILYKNKISLRVYSGLRGLDISIRRILTRECEKELRMKKNGEKPI